MHTRLVLGTTFAFFVLATSCSSDPTSDPAAGDGGSPNPDPASADGGGSGDGDVLPPGDTVIHEEAEITTNTTWKRGRHVIKDPFLYVRDGATLTVEGCAVVALPEGGVLRVAEGSAVDFAGTETCRIKVTSAKPTPARGDWKTILLEPLGKKSRFAFTDVEYGGREEFGAVSTSGELEMHHSSIRESVSDGLDLRPGATLPGFTANTFTKNAGTPVYASPNEAMQLTASNTYTGNGLDAIRLGGETTATGSLKVLPVPYSPNAVTVGRGTLTLEAGVVMRMPKSSEFIVDEGASLVVDGTPDAKVTFTSDLKQVGGWEGIVLRAGAGPVRFRNAVVEYAGATLGAVVDTGATSFEMTNTIVRDAKGPAVNLDLARSVVAFTGNTMTRTAVPVSARAALVDKIGDGTYTGNAIDAIQVYYLDNQVQQSATWLPVSVPIVVPGLFVSSPTAATTTLTLGEGLILKIEDTGGITVSPGAKLVTLGTAAKPVTLTSFAKAPVAQAWGPIRTFGEISLTQTKIEFGGNGPGAIRVESIGSVTLDAVTFANGGACDITYGGANVTPTTGFTKCP